MWIGRRRPSGKILGGEVTVQRDQGGEAEAHVPKELEPSKQGNLGS